MEKIELLSIKNASKWASGHLHRNVTAANISYLVQYGKVKKYGNNGTTAVNKYDLINYYRSYNGQRETNWRAKLGEDLNWTLSFDYLKEKDTTKHIHRLHPYKGKFIPQLVEYFIDSHTDNFKKEVYFKKGDIILDPFSGSGTTMVQANELGINSIGIDISAFNTLIANIKVEKVDFEDLNKELERITNSLEKFIFKNKNIQFESELLEELNVFNKKYFPSPEFKIKVSNKEIIEKEYTPQKEKEFLKTFEKLRRKYNLKLKQERGSNFLEKWYLEPVKDELEIGPLFKGQGREARNSYIEGISLVLINCKKYLQDNYDIFLVANDKYNLYPKIADKSGMTIVNKYKRPVLNRTEKNKSAYSEIIFHLKEK